MVYTLVWPRFLDLSEELCSSAVQLWVLPTHSKSEHMHYSSHFKEKQIFLFLQQVVQQASAEQRIWVTEVTSWPPTTQVPYLLLHSKAHPVCRTTAQAPVSPCDLWPIWQGRLEPLFTAWCHFWLCVFQLLLLGALALPIQIKGCTNTNTGVLQVCQLCTVMKVSPRCSSTVLWPCLKLASPSARTKINFL